MPTDKITPLAEFDGNVVVERTAGEVSARCHDEQANFLALNLMHDIVTGAKSVREARNYYTKEFADYRRKEPTPYIERLQFTPSDRSVADPDVRVLSDEELKGAAKEGKARGERADTLKICDDPSPSRKAADNDTEAANLPRTGSLAWRKPAMAPRGRWLQPNWVSQ